MCTCFAISHNGYPVAPVLPTSIALFFQSISVPGALCQAFAITITRFRGTLSLPNNDYRQRLWHYDSRLPCGIVGTHTLTQLSSSRSLSESADNNHECIRFFLFGNFLILAHCAVNVFGNFTATLPMLSQFLQIKREKSSSASQFFAKTDECQHRSNHVDDEKADDMQRRKPETRRARLAQFFIEVFVGLPTLAFQGFAFASLLFSFFLFRFLLFRFLLLFGSFMAHIAHLIAVHMAYVRSSNTLSYICDAWCRMPHALFTVGLAFNVVCLSVPSLCLSARPPFLPSLSVHADNISYAWQVCPKFLLAQSAAVEFLIFMLVISQHSQQKKKKRREEGVRVGGGKELWRLFYRKRNILCAHIKFVLFIFVSLLFSLYERKGERTRKQSFYYSPPSPLPFSPCLAAIDCFSYVHT